MTEDIDWQGRDVVDPDGEKIGKVEEVYVDEESDRPTWLLVSRGLLSLTSVFIPFEGAEEDSDGKVRVPHAKAHIDEAPDYRPGPEVDEEREAEVYRHYELDPPRRNDDDDEGG